MKIEIVDDSGFPSDADGVSRIEEIDDIIDVDTCFICNGKPIISKTIYPNNGKETKWYKNIEFINCNLRIIIKSLEYVLVF